MTSPLCVATGGWCRRVFHYRPPTPMYRNSPSLCTIVLQIPSLMPLKMRKSSLDRDFKVLGNGRVLLVLRNVKPFRVLVAESDRIDGRCMNQAL